MISRFHATDCEYLLILSCRLVTETFINAKVKKACLGVQVLGLILRVFPCSWGSHMVFAGNHNPIFNHFITILSMFQLGPWIEPITRPAFYRYPVTGPNLFTS